MEIQQEANPSIQNENENTVIQKEARTSSENENQDEMLAKDIETMFVTLKPPLSAKCRIYKVPYHLRKWNNDAYTPRIISIGPIHHNKKRFQTMENTKLRYFKSFMRRAEIKLKNLVSSIREMEDSIRCCYVESTVQLKSDDFVKMILLDASFILELFLRAYEESWEHEDPMLVEQWLLSKMIHELVLLENQLPFFVIEKLYNLALPYRANYLRSLIQLTFDFFNDFNIHKKPPYAEIKHFTDLLRFFQLPPLNELPRRVTEVTLPKYTATQLNEAGVKFKKVLRKSVLDLKFERGVLEIPLLRLEDQTEDLLRNIMALEQCDSRIDAYVTDFYAIVDGLINTTKDVDLLCDEGIVVNWLGDSKAVISMFNNLNKGVFIGSMNSDYNCLCKKLNAFYEVSWHRTKATLKQQYFSTPWRTTSTIAATILLMLTLIQTIVSIIQVV